MNSQVEAWGHLSKAGWDLVQRDPLSAPAVHRWTWLAGVPESPWPGPGMRRREDGQRPPRPAACDVLLLTVSPRPHYLQMTRTIAQAVQALRPELRIGVHPARVGQDAQASEEPVPAGAQRVVFALPRRPGAADVRRALRVVNHVGKAGDPALKAWFTESSRSTRFREALGAVTIARAVRSQIQQTGAQVVISLGEHVGLGCYGVAGAKAAGCRVLEPLHGLPNRRYSPVLADELWVWGQTTRNALHTFGVPDAQLVAVGALEFAGQALQPMSSDAPDESPSVLFLSQAHGRDVWKIDAFDHAFRVLVDALQSSGTSYRLVVRPHPSDSAADLQPYHAYASRAGMTVEISGADRALHEEFDKRWSLVCTASSSAVLEGVRRGLPTALIWNAELDALHGLPFLPASRVVRDVDAMRTLLASPDAQDAAGVVRDVMGDLDAAAGIAAERVAMAYDHAQKAGRS